MAAETTTTPRTKRSPVSDTKMKAIKPKGMPAYEANISLFAIDASTCFRSITAWEVVEIAPMIVATTTASRGLMTKVINGTANKEKPNPERV